MGLVKQAIDLAAGQSKEILRGGVSAIKGVLGDKFKSVISCDNLSDNILMMQKSTESGRIPRESAIVVQVGQMAVVVDSGRVMDAVAEAGVYIFDESTTPCFAAGDFESSLNEIWGRFTFGGEAVESQQVYFFNMLEIRDNGFGTRGPVVYRDWDHPVVNPRIPNGLSAMSVSITAFGTFTFKIADPALFMKEVCGTAKVFEKTRISDQLQTEVIGTFQQLLNRMGSEEYKIPVLELPNASSTIEELLRQKNTAESFERRGLKLVSLVIENVRLEAASQKKIDQYELGGDQYTQQGLTTAAHGEAIVNAAKNTAGVGDAVVGIGFIDMMGQNKNSDEIPASPGSGAAPVPMAAAASTAGLASIASASPGPGGVMCSCGTVVTGKFCPNCGKAAPQIKYCRNCGKPVTGKFCTECGTPVSQKKICPDCNTEVSGNFCPNCGKQIQME